MIITNQLLQQLINEEFEKALSKRRKPLNERLQTSQQLHRLPAHDLLVFAKAYAMLGRAVQEQLDNMISDPDGANVNGNAVDMIKDRIGGANAEIDEAIRAWENGAFGPDYSGPEDL